MEDALKEDIEVAGEGSEIDIGYCVRVAVQ
jgi:hypothetical protein